MKNENRDLSVCQIGVRAFREASSLALPPTAQWGSDVPLELNYKGHYTTRTYLVVSEEAAVPRLDTLTMKDEKSTLV